MKEKKDFEGTVQFTATDVTEYEFSIAEEVKKTIYHNLSVRYRPKGCKPGPVRYLIKDGKAV